MKTQDRSLFSPGKEFAPLVHRLCASTMPPLLMFDYDGTLAPFVVERQRAYPYPFVVPLLEQLRRQTLARLVIVSGREIQEVRRLLGIEPSLEMWGSHGWERLTEQGTLIRGELPGEAARLLDEVREWLTAERLGEHMEQKTASMALHWRGMEKEQQRALKQRVETRWQEMGGDKILQLHRFDGGFEWRLPGWNKAEAVSTLLGEVPPGTPMVYFGDDLTDEDAFKALPEDGLSVLVRNQRRPSAARLWVRPPGQLQQLLELLLAELNTKHHRP